MYPCQRCAPVGFRYFVLFCFLPAVHRLPVPDLCWFQPALKAPCLYCGRLLTGYSFDADHTFFQKSFQQPTGVPAFLQYIVCLSRTYTIYCVFSRKTGRKTGTPVGAKNAKNFFKKSARTKRTLSSVFCICQAHFRRHPQFQQAISSSSPYVS